MQRYPLFISAFIGLFLAACTSSTSEKTQAVAFPWAFTSVKTNFAEYVNPFIGTGGHGHTFPGPTAPFGMVQLGPDTRLDGWDGCSGYHYSDSIIYGFSHTHLSGTGCSDYGDILVAPESGAALFQNGADGRLGYRSHFSKQNEKAEAGYYSVKLDEPQVFAELTASPHAGIHRYTFSKSEDHALLFELNHRDEVLDSYIEKIDDHTIQGYRYSKAWAVDQRVWFYATFSKPIKAQQFWKEEVIKDSLHLHGTNIKLWLNFGSEKNVEVKVALSPVSCANAKQNMEAEVGDMNFDQVREKVRQQWNSELSKIEVHSDNIKQKRIFYTALYHCFVAPNMYADVNGDYRGRDNAVHRDSLHPQYTVFSLWDTYRALHPLFTIIQQKRTNDFVRTFLRQYEQGGRLPVWELSANETDCMIGYHSVPVIADAWMKGLTDYDTSLAYQAMLSSASLDLNGLRKYRQCGYLPAEGQAESVSKTLEYAYDDWCIAQIAERLHKDEATKDFYRRSQSWKNLYDKQTGFFRPRQNNAFVEPFSPNEVNYHFTEANAWQYSLYVPQDLDGLIAAHGGDAGFCAHLDAMFQSSTETSGRVQADITGLLGQYAQGNEPSHHMAYLYACAGQPWKTQDRVTQLAREFYADAPDGLAGNEDCGQMSAWYVMTSLGFYPVTPGSNAYVMGIPQFDDITIHLENGKTCTIKTNRQTPTANHIASVQVNGAAWNSTALPHQAVVDGGAIVFNLTDEAQPSWGTAVADRFHTQLDSTYLIPTVPRITNTAARTFTSSMSVVLGADPDSKILYTLDGLHWEKYTTPIQITEESRLQTYAVLANGTYSDTTDSRFFKAPNWKSVTMKYPYAPQYAAGGTNALIDGITGESDFRTGTWQGYEGVNFDALVDLGSSQKISAVRLNFLQDENAWIFQPDSVVFFSSNDNSTFTRMGSMNNTIPPLKKGEQIKLYYVSGNARTARYIHVVAYTKGKCPPGHKAASEKSWLFTDEIQILIAR